MLLILRHWDLLVSYHEPEEHWLLLFQSFLKKHDTALFCLLKRVVLSFNKESAELVLALLEFLRQIFNTDSLGCCGDESMIPMDVDGSSPARFLAFSVTEMKQLLQWKESSQDHLLHELEKQITEYSKDDDSLESVLENVVGLRQMLDSDSNATVSTEQDTEPVLPAPESLQTQFNSRTVYVLADVFDDQLKTLWLSPFQAEEIDVDLDMVKVDLVELSQRCCTDFDLKAELERSFLMEPSSPGRSKAAKGFKLGKHKHETFITSSGKLDYIEPAKRAHIMALPRGRGRGAFGQLCRPHDIFRQRKQNTSRPPSMHVDDFVAAEIKDIGPPTGLLLPKRTVKGSLKALSRGLFSGNRGGRGVFHNQTRFFSPPAPKGLCTSRDLCRPWETSMVQHPLPVTHGAALAILRRNYNHREGGRGSAWSPQGTPGTHRGTYNEGRGGQNNFNRGPPQSRQPAAGVYRLAPRDRAPRGRGVGPSWASGGGGGSGSRGKFGGGGCSGSSSGVRGRHVRSFTR